MKKYINYFLDWVTYSKIIDFLLFYKVVILLLFIGVVNYYTYKNVYIESKIDVSDLLNIFLAVILAILIPKTIWKTIESKKWIKQILQNTCDELIKKNNDLISYISNSSTNEFDTKLVLIYIKNIWFLLNQVTENCKLHNNDFSNTKIISTFSSYRWVITNDIRNLTFQYNEGYKYKCIEESLKLELHINQARYWINLI